MENKEIIAATDTDGGVGEEVEAIDVEFIKDGE